MSFTDLASQRHSTRSFSEKPLSKSQIEEVLEAARLAPSACNKQPWHFYVVSDPDVRAKMLHASRPAFLKAPVLIVAVGLHRDAWHRPADGKDHTDVDVSIAVEHICLQAQDLGLSSCWVCSFDVPGVAEALGLPEGEEPIALIPLGYPDEEILPQKSRKPLDQIATFL